MNEEAESRRVLIVDDEICWLRGDIDALEHSGYEVKTARSAQEARKRYSDEEFDYAFIDGLNGDCFDLYADINARRKVIFTGDGEIIQEARQRGLNAEIKGTERTLLSIIEAMENEN